MKRIDKLEKDYITEFQLYRGQFIELHSGHAVISSTNCPLFFGMNKMTKKILIMLISQLLMKGKLIHVRNA